MKTEYEKCLAGEPFIGSRDPKIVETILHTRRLLAQFNATDYADTERKQALLHEMFGSMGKGVHVDIDFHCEYGKHIFIGDKVIINMNCTCHRGRQCSNPFHSCQLRGGGQSLPGDKEDRRYYNLLITHH